MKITFYPEICCDECNQVIHNHMDCPDCKVSYAGTDHYGDLEDLGIGDILICQECGTKFKLINSNGYISEYDWEKVC